jgi:outer membrane protein assembly factor BamB
MSYRGVYRDGIVVLEGEVDLRNGTTVEVNPARGKGKGRRKVSSTPRRDRKAAQVHPFIALAGLWKDRPEWRGRSSVEIVRELRRRSPSTRARRRGRHG